MPGWDHCRLAEALPPQRSLLLPLPPLFLWGFFYVSFFNLKGSSLISELSSPWARSDASSSSLAEMESLSFFRANVEGLAGEVRGLETVHVQTGEDMTEERVLLLDRPFTTKTSLECCFSSLLISS